MTDNNQMYSETIAISEKSLTYLKGTSGWAMFLAIIGFILCALMLIAGFAMGAVSSSLGVIPGLPISPVWFSLIYLISAILGFFPSFFLLRFASKSRTASQTLKSIDLDISLLNLRAHYRWIGIITILSILFYVVLIVTIVLMGPTIMGNLPQANAPIM